MLKRTLPGGPFTADMAADLGISRRDLRQLLDHSLVRHVLQGVYVDAEVPDSLDLRIAAASKVLLPHRVLCDRTAAWLHGVDAFRYRELEIPAPVEMWVRSGHARVRRRGTSGGERLLLPSDIMTLGDVRVTTPLRTALDLGCRLSRSEALAVLDAFMRQHELTRADLRAQLGRFVGRRGVVQLRELVAIADPRAASTGESWTRLAMLDDGLPMPTLQCPVVHHGNELYWLDLGYGRHRVGVEYDGEESHDSPEQMEADRIRRQWLADNGWTIIVVRKGDFTDEQRAVWLRQVREALGYI